MLKRTLILVYTIAFALACSQPEYFNGVVTYQYTYESNSVNVDSLVGLKPYKSEFRIDNRNYQSTFYGKDTVTYYYLGLLGKCLSGMNADSSWDCEDYHMTTDTVINFRELESDEIILGKACKILEWQGKYFFNRFYVATDFRISPVTYEKHLAYNWKFYAHKAKGGLILKSVHRFKNYTVTGVAVEVRDVKNFESLTKEVGQLDKLCK